MRHLPLKPWCGRSIALFWERTVIQKASPNGIVKENLSLIHIFASTMPPAAQREFMEFEGWKSRHDARKLSTPDLVYDDEVLSGAQIIRIKRISTNWREWIKTLGEITYQETGIVRIHFGSEWFTVNYEEKDGSLEFRIKTSNTKDEILFIAALKNILRKSAYCIGCQAVSYTHLDVYKRQHYSRSMHKEKLYKHVHCGEAPAPCWERNNQPSDTGSCACQQ